MRQIHIRAVLMLVALGGIATAAPSAAEAGCPATKEITLSNGKKRKQPAVGKVERALGGQIITSKKDFPGGDFDSAQSYINKVKGQKDTKFWEDKANKSWKVYFAAFFKTPVDELEVQIRLIDVTGGGSQQITKFAQDLDFRCETSIISNMKLDRESFGVNKKLQMVMETSRGSRLAVGTFEILGEAEKYTGKAVFTDEDTREGEVPPPPEEEKRPDPIPEKDPEIDKPIDENDPALNSPNLDPEEGMQDPPDQRKAQRGCGCRTDGSGAAGGIILFAAVALLNIRRRR
jgi:MYXO-CTERM domain-containing protein